MFDKLEVKLTSFADDVIFLVKDPCSLKEFVKLIKEFGPFSSLTLKGLRGGGGGGHLKTRFFLNNSKTGGDFSTKFLAIPCL